MNEQPEQTPEPPVVFLSYSHDSREHKQWVGKLAAALRDKHVEVIFDQWDLEPGDDVPKFMERAVKTNPPPTRLYRRRENGGVEKANS